MKKKNNVVILPKVNYTYKYNNTTPSINVKKTDYESIRDIVEGKDDNKTLPKQNENIINKVINKFHIVKLVFF